MSRNHELLHSRWRVEVSKPMGRDPGGRLVLYCGGVVAVIVKRREKGDTYRPLDRAVLERAAMLHNSLLNRRTAQQQCSWCRRRESALMIKGEPVAVCAECAVRHHELVIRAENQAERLERETLDEAVE